MKKLVVIALCHLAFLFSQTNAQDVAMMYYYENETDDVRAFLLKNSDSQWIIPPAITQFKTQGHTFADNIFHDLTCTGDFDGDGIDEIAFFVKKTYTPNCFAEFECPPYSTTNAMLLKSNGKSFYPLGSWYSELDTIFDASKIRFTISADFNKDDKCDVAVIYDEGNESFKILTFLSNGNAFQSPQLFSDAVNTSLLVSGIKKTLSGDFNADGFSDLAILYKSDTINNIYVLTSTGSSFSDAKCYYSVPDSILFDDIHFALSGKFNADNRTDIALLYQSKFRSKSDSGNLVLVFHSKTDSFSCAANCRNITPVIDNYKKVLSAQVTDLNSDNLSDIVLMYISEKADTTEEKLFVLTSADSVFSNPVCSLETYPYEFNFHKVKYFIPGRFSFEPSITVCTWQNDKQGALTFSFDDGYTSTIENAKYLYTKGVRGTHNVITHLTNTDEYAEWSVMQADTLGNEYGSHSYTHPRLNQIPLVEAAEELSRSKQELDYHLSKNAVSFVFPGGAFSHEVMHLPELRNNYLSARTSMHGYNHSSPIDEYGLKSQVILNTTNKNHVYNWIDKTEGYGYWTFLMYHCIGYQGSDPDLIEYNSTIDDFRAVVDYACLKNLWIDSQEHVIKYIKERNAIKKINYSFENANKLRIILDDGLDDQIYDVPLTLKVALPSHWQADSVLVLNNGGSKAYRINYDGGKSYTYFNCLPNNKEVYIENQIPLSLNQANRHMHKITVSPNPVKSTALISLKTSVAANTYVRIFDCLGKEIITYNNLDDNKIMFYRNGLSAGVYLVVLMQNGIVASTGKMLIE